MFNKQYMFIVIGLAFAGYAFADDVFEFKGARMFTSEAELHAHNAGVECNGSAEHRKCFEESTIAGIKSGIFYNFYSDKLLKITSIFDANNGMSFIKISDALKEKYGDPITQSQSGIFHSWQFEYKYDSVMIELHQYVGGVTNGALEFITKESIEADNKEREEKAKSAAKDL